MVVVAAVGAGRTRGPWWRRGAFSVLGPRRAAPLPVVARPAQRRVGPVDTTRDSVSFVELRSMSRDGLVVYIRVDGSGRHCRLGLLFKRCRRATAWARLGRRQVQTVADAQRRVKIGNSARSVMYLTDG